MQLGKPVCAVGNNWIILNIASAELRVLAQRRRFFFLFCCISFSHWRNVLHKGVDIKVGLKHREDEFSFQIVKLVASLQERTTQGCRFYSRRKTCPMGETKSKLHSSSFKLCMERSVCCRNWLGGDSPLLHKGL